MNELKVINNMACGLRELVLDQELSENHVKGTIYGTTKCWHNLFTWHISKKNNMAVDISHNATLDEETTLCN